MFDIKSGIAEGVCKIEDKNVTLTINNLCFGYSENNDVLHDICLELKPGERLSILGETGCGKTTLAKLLARLYEFETGEILLNGVSIKELKSESLSSAIAYMTEMVYII